MINPVKSFLTHGPRKSHRREFLSDSGREERMIKKSEKEF